MGLLPNDAERVAGRSAIAGQGLQASWKRADIVRSAPEEFSGRFRNRQSCPDC